MIFPQVKFDNTVQVGDKIRVDVSASFLSPDETEITEILVTPEVGATPVDITALKYIDWVYLTSGAKVFTVSITTALTTINSINSILALTSAEDMLFSSDQEIIQHEHDIYRFLPDGRSSFNHVHRSVQTMILDMLSNKGVTVTKANIYQNLEIKQCAKYLALYVIFAGVQNDVGDIYSVKAAQYKALSDEAFTRALMGLDVDGDGTADIEYKITTKQLVRR